MKRQREKCKFVSIIERIMPAYAVLPLLLCLGWNCVVYWSGQYLCINRYHYDFTNDFDRMVPLQSGWVSIYVLSYLYWVIGYVMAARYNSKEQFYRFVFADILSRTICGIFYFVIPTTNVRPELPMNNIWDWMLAIIYRQDLPYNLFPSIHCLISFLCYLGVKDSKEVHRLVKAGILLFALLVCVSTQFTKQHYIVDVAGGFVVAIVAFAIAKKTEWYRPFAKLFDRMNHKILKI